MKRIIKNLDEHFEEYLMGAFLIGISLVMFAQIIMRFIGSSIPWAEELCRYFYIWSVFLSISFTIKKQTILRVDILLNNLQKNIRNIVEIILQVITITVFTFLGYYAILTVNGVKESMQTSPAMELPMYLVYMIIPIGFFLTSIRSTQQIYLIVTDNLVKEEVDYSEAQ